MIYKNFIKQEKGSCCFVYAVINCLIYLKKEIKNKEKAFDIAGCKNGSTIYHQKVIDFLNCPIKLTSNEQTVFKKGGIINIMHPIYNGHSVFIFPEKEGLTLVNSWLGPNIMKNIGINEIKPLISYKCGNFYYIL